MSRASTLLARASDLVRAERIADARAVLLRAAAVSPNDPAVCGLLAYVLAMSFEFERSAFYGERAVAAQPDRHDLRLNLAATYTELGRPDDAARHAEVALTLRPDDVPSIERLAAALTGAGRCIDAERLLREQLSRHPNESRLTARLADVCSATGRAAEAVCLLRDAAARHPDDHALATDLCSTIPYDPSLAPEEAFEHFRAYGELVRRIAPASLKRPAPDLAPDRPLRLAFLSPDLRAHAVVTFLEPILEHLDREAFTPFAYATAHREDAVTARLRSHVPRWRRMPQARWPELARAVLEDCPDVLFDLSGHSAGHALPAFQARLAPLQVSYLGWPASTGVLEMDVRLTDSIADPPGSEAFHTERLLRLDPCALCYRPWNDAPPASFDAPDRPPTLGSFNAIDKLNERVVALWARVLRDTPGARLVLKHTALAHEQGRAVLERRFTDAGVEPHRLTLLPPTGHAEHLAAYHAVDVALDPFPFNGATTTCDALFMGVPVVTLPGVTSASRVASSILSVVGLEASIAADPDDYASKTLALLRDVDRLRAGRAALRERVLASPLCDAGSFTRRFEQAIRSAWRLRCATG